MEESAFNMIDNVPLDCTASPSHLDSLPSDPTYSSHSTSFLFLTGVVIFIPGTGLRIEDGTFSLLSAPPNVVGWLPPHGPVPGTSPPSCADSFFPTRSLPSLRNGSRCGSRCRPIGLPNASCAIMSFFCSQRWSL